MARTAIMTLFVIAYDLVDADSYDYEVLIDQLKKLRSNYIQESVWLVDWLGTDIKLLSHLAPFFSKDDSIPICSTLIRSNICYTISAEITIVIYRTSICQYRAEMEKNETTFLMSVTDGDKGSGYVRIPKPVDLLIGEPDTLVFEIQTRKKITVRMCD